MVYCDITNISPGRAEATVYAPRYSEVPLESKCTGGFPCAPCSIKRSHRVPECLSKSSAGADVGARSYATFALESTFNFSRIRPNSFAENR